MAAISNSGVVASVEVSIAAEAELEVVGVDIVTMYLKESKKVQKRVKIMSNK